MDSLSWVAMLIGIHEGGYEYHYHQKTRPSEKRKEIIQTIKGLSEQMIKNGERLRADLYQDLDDKDTLYFMEEWQAREDLEKFKTSKSLAVVLGLGTLLVESVEIKHAVKVLTRQRAGQQRSLSKRTPDVPIPPFRWRFIYMSDSSGHPF
ncbi:MAG: quinol monooxygenase YgiN [Desulforhopalus sp.]|jgi:quinol monooxygenase YgiN